MVPAPDWRSIYQSELIEALGSPEIASLEERSVKDRERLSAILDSDLKSQRRSVRNMQARLGLRPKDADLRFKLGEFYYRSSLPHLAEIELLTLLSLEQGTVPQDVLGTAHKYLTDIYLQSGAQGRAIYHARRAHRDLPGDAAVMFIWAWTLRDGADIETAVAVAEAGVAIDGKNASVLVMLARLRMDEERHGEAVELGRRAAAVNPDHLRVHLVLGQALSAMDKEYEAEAEMEIHRRLLLLNTAKLLDRRPPLEEYERAAALVAYHLHVGHTEQAHAELARSFQLVPNNGPARVMEARLRVAEGAEAEGKRLLEMLLDEQPDQIMARRALISILADAKDPNLRDARAAIEMGTLLLGNGGERDFDVLFSLGLAEASLGLNLAAKRHFVSALGIEPTNSRAKAELEKLSGGR